MKEIKYESLLLPQRCHNTAEMKCHLVATRKRTTTAPPTTTKLINGHIMEALYSIHEQKCLNIIYKIKISILILILIM